MAQGFHFPTEPPEFLLLLSGQSFSLPFIYFGLQIPASQGLAGDPELLRYFRD
jgi:hypothetical protein